MKVQYLPCLVCLVVTVLPPLLSAADEKPLPPPALPKPWFDVAPLTARGVISPDGKLIATVRERFHDIILYDRFTGKEVRRFGGKEKSGSRLFAFTPDGKRLLTHHGTQDDTQKPPERYDVLVWEVASGKLQRKISLQRYQGMRLPRTSATLYGVSNKVLVAAGMTEMGTVYDLETGKKLGDFPGTHRPARLALSRDGKWLVTAGRDDKLCVWDVEKRRLAHTLYEHTARVEAVAISVDGAWCASTTVDKRVWVFDRVKGKERARTNALLLSNRDCDLLFTPNGKTLVGTGEGAHFGLMVWDWQTSREIRGGYPREGTSVLVGGFKNPWNVEETYHASMAADGTLFTATGSELYIWDLFLMKPSTPNPSREPGTPGNSEK